MIKKNIKHQDYKDTLPNNKPIFHAMNTIRSVNHQLGSYELNKISLFCFDDKRYLHSDGVSSYAYDHCQMNKLFFCPPPLRSPRLAIFRVSLLAWAWTGTSTAQLWTGSVIAQPNTPTLSSRTFFYFPFFPSKLIWPRRVFRSILKGTSTSTKR